MGAPELSVRYPLIAPETACPKQDAAPNKTTKAIEIIFDIAKPVSFRAMRSSS
jgi:hypothetical protein